MLIKLFLCFFHSLDGFCRIDSSQHSEIDGIGHRFVADRARVQIVAGVIPISKTRWMAGIAHCLIKIEATVGCAAGPDPLIDGRANGFPVFGVVVCALIRQQCCDEYLDSVLVGAIDDLLITRNDVLRAWAAASSRPIQLLSLLHVLLFHHPFGILAERAVRAHERLGGFLISL